MKKQPLLFEFTNEYRTWYCVRHVYYIPDWEIKHEERRLYMYQNKVGYCGSDSYRFRTEEDRLMFIIKLGVHN